MGRNQRKKNLNILVILEIYLIQFYIVNFINLIPNRCQKNKKNFKNHIICTNKLFRIDYDAKNIFNIFFVF